MGLPLKKKKVVVVHKKKKDRKDDKIWRSAWGRNRWKRKKHKKLYRTYGSKDLEKKKASVLSSSAKRYKNFKFKIRPTSTVKSAASAQRGTVALRCTKACKVNFSTLKGIKKKSNALSGYITVWFRKYPSIHLTRKSKGHRMGKGKGKFSARIATFKKGEVILEISYIDEGIFNNYYRAIIKTLPVPVTRTLMSELGFKAIVLAGLNVKNIKRYWKIPRLKKRKEWWGKKKSVEKDDDEEEGSESGE